MPSAPNAVSSGARQRSTDGQTIPISSGAGRLEEADGAVQRRPRRREIGEERALQVRQRRRPVLVRASGEFLDPFAGQSRQVLGRALQRREGDATGLVR